MVLTKKINNSTSVGRKETKKKNRWDDIKNIKFVPKKIKTALDYKKQKFNSKSSIKLIKAFKSNVKNIKKRVKNFGYSREKELMGFKISKKTGKNMPNYKMSYIWNPPQYVVDELPELKFPKRRCMYSKDSEEVITYMLLKEIQDAKGKLHILKKSQPKRGYGLVTMNDIDTIFGKTQNQNYSNYDETNNNNNIKKNKSINNKIGFDNVEQQLKHKFGELLVNMLLGGGCRQQLKKEKKKKRKKKRK